MTTQQPEALRLADELDAEFARGRISNHTGRKAAIELRRQHARIAELEAQLESIGAGGVSGPLMGCASIAASAGSEPVAWLVCSVNSDGTLSLEHAAAWQEAAHEHINDAITEHGIDEAASWVVRPAYTHPSPPEGMVGGLQVYRCKIKSRKQIDREIPREQQGWWADVAAGQKLLLRQAVQSDLERCILGEKRSRNPADYMCETHTNGSLVSKVALEYMNPEQNVFAAPPTTSAGSRKGE